MQRNGGSLKKKKGGGIKIEKIGRSEENGGGTTEPWQKSREGKKISRNERGLTGVKCALGNGQKSEEENESTKKEEKL